VFEYYRQHADAGPSFDAAMSSAAQSAAEQICDAYDFSGFATVADVGGGRGILLATVLRKNRDVRGVLFDLPGVLEQAPPLLEREGVADRCRVVGGDFFDGAPDGPTPTC
jgi:O-methyltransferase domain